MKMLQISLDAFGGQMSQVGPENGGQPARPSFDELIKGEYKKDFGERVQAILDRRLKTVHAELAAARPVMALLRERYGIPDGAGAAEKVRRALENDADYWTSAAQSVGMPPAQYRRMVRAEADNSQFRQFIAAQETARYQRDLFFQLKGQAEKVRKQYPSFDLVREMEENPGFARMVRYGIDLLTAYQVCHQQEILEQAAQDAQSRTVNRLNDNRSRPAENGSGGSQPVKLGSDPSKWSKAQFRDIERRVARGERIVL